MTTPDQPSEYQFPPDRHDPANQEQTDSFFIPPPSVPHPEEPTPPLVPPAVQPNVRVVMMAFGALAAALGASATEADKMFAYLQDYPMPRAPGESIRNARSALLAIRNGDVK